MGWILQPVRLSRQTAGCERTTCDFSAREERQTSVVSPGVANERSGGVTVPLLSLFWIR